MLNGAHQVLCKVHQTRYWHSNAIVCYAHLSGYSRKRCTLMWRSKNGQACSIHSGQRLLVCIWTPQQWLRNSPVQTLQYPEVKYSLHDDSRYYALGAVLSQEQDNSEKILGYFRYKLHDLEMWYPSYETELFGIPDAILHLKFHQRWAE
jgi:hypothetical protein